MEATAITHTDAFPVFVHSFIFFVCVRFFVIVWDRKEDFFTIVEYV